MELMPIMQKWKAEAGIKGPILYKTIPLKGGEYDERELIITSTRVGLLIGYHGKLVEKYKKIMMQLVPYIKKVSFEEAAYYL